MTPGLSLGRTLLCLLLLGGSASSRHAVAAQPADGEGQPFLQSFSPRDYHADTLCRSIVQDPRGLMYITNHALVLEYDGSA